MARYGNKRRPSTIHCPICKGVASTRKERACRFCGVKLYYVGDIVAGDDERAFVWVNDKWLPVTTAEKGTSHGQEDTG